MCFSYYLFLFVFLVVLSFRVVYRLLISPLSIFFGSSIDYFELSVQRIVLLALFFLKINCIYCLFLLLSVFSLLFFSMYAPLSPVKDITCA